MVYSISVVHLKVITSETARVYAGLYTRGIEGERESFGPWQLPSFHAVLLCFSSFYFKSFYVLCMFLYFCFMIKVETHTRTRTRTHLDVPAMFFFFFFAHHWCNGTPLNFCLSSTTNQRMQLCVNVCAFALWTQQTVRPLATSESHSLWVYVCLYVCLRPGFSVV